MADETWLKENYRESWKESFDANGFLIIPGLVNESIVEEYATIYDRLLDLESTKAHRHDLGSHASKTEENDSSENICQLMWPSNYDSSLLDRSIYKRLLCVVKRIMGQDMEFDFDMLINKFPKSNTSTPWHQDESYWPDMPDKRAVSCWVALDDATLDNGCMWFVKGSHLEPTLRPHRRVKEGHHARCTDACSEAEGEEFPFKKGACSLHHGRTLHYTRGNITDSQRRAYILNFRPKAMIDWERRNGFDHGKTK